jgi:hypothetical protein
MIISFSEVFLRLDATSFLGKPNMGGYSQCEAMKFSSSLQQLFNFTDNLFLPD